MSNINLAPGEMTDGPPDVVLDDGRFRREVIDARTLEADRQDDIEGFIASLDK